jgi:hypothetical protein
MSISRIAGLFLAVAVSVLTPGSATAGWDEGVAAYQQGDSRTAFREFMPLALAGDPAAERTQNTWPASTSTKSLTTSATGLL